MHTRAAFIFATLLSLVVTSREAAACGCFAPPDPVQSVLQAGERILFAADGQNIEAHIQIQFSGKATEFGWLLPMPAIPKLDIGTDELFAQLLQRVGPAFEVTRKYPNDCPFAPSEDGGLSDDMPSNSSDLTSPNPNPSPLVRRPCLSCHGRRRTQRCKEFCRGQWKPRRR